MVRGVLVSLGALAEVAATAAGSFDGVRHRHRDAAAAAYNSKRPVAAGLIGGAHDGSPASAR